MKGNKVCNKHGVPVGFLRMTENIPCCPKDGKGYFVRRQVILGLTPTYAVACAHHFQCWYIFLLEGGKYI